MRKVNWEYAADRLSFYFIVAVLFSGAMLALRTLLKSIIF